MATHTHKEKRWQLLEIYHLKFEVIYSDYLSPHGVAIANDAYLITEL